MKTAEKRLLALLLVLVMVAGFVPVTARAEGEEPAPLPQLSKLMFSEIDFQATEADARALEPEYEPTIREYTLHVYDYEGDRTLFAYSALGENTESTDKVYATYMSCLIDGYQVKISVPPGVTYGTNLSESIKENSIVGCPITILVGPKKTPVEAYEVNIVRIATLSGLEIKDENGNDIELNAVFDRGTTTYTAVNPLPEGSVLSVTATATAEDAALTINGEDATSGTAVTVTPEWDGEGKYILSITVGGGTAVQSTYTVELTKEASTLPELSKLMFSQVDLGATEADARALDPVFTPETRNYTLNVYDYESTNAVLAYSALGNNTEATDKVYATYMSCLIDGYQVKISVPPGVSYGTNLSESFKENSIVGCPMTILVGPKKTPVEAYWLNIVRVATLSGLSITDGAGNAIELSTDFNRGTTAYTAAAPISADAVLNVTATATAEDASLAVNGEAATNGTATSVTPVWDENGKYTMTVKAYGGDSIPTEYTITFEKEGGATPSDTSIEIVQPPAKLAYKEGDTFDPDGIVVEATFADGTTAIVDLSDLTFTPAGALTTADTVITVSYGTATATLAITVEGLLPGTGTSTDPYVISSAADLTALSERVAAGETFAGKYFSIVSSITLPADWTPIGALQQGRTNEGSGKYINPFSGNINGGGNTLTVPSGGRPLFKYVREASISNLNLYAPYIPGNGLVESYVVDYGADGNNNTGIPATINVSNVTIKSGSIIRGSGFLGGYASAANYANFTNCKVESNVKIGCSADGSSAGLSNIGSIAGAFNGTISGCESSAAVYGVNNVGGLAGSRGQSTNTFSIQNSQFYGTVNATGNNAGGILGAGYYHYTAPNAFGVTVENCTVNATVSGGSNVGGILGAEDGVDQYWDNGPLTIRGNTFSGTLSGSGRIGGIAGFIRSMNRNVYVENNQFSGAAKEIGFITHIDTSAVSFGMHDGTFYYNTSNYNTYTEEEWAAIYEVVDADWINSGRYLNNSIAVANQNRTDDPLGVGGGEVVITDLIITGYKDEYTVGEEFTTAGMSVTAKYSDNSTVDVDLAEVSFTGFSSTAAGVKTITASWGGFSKQFDVTVIAPAGETIKVKLTVLGDTLHDMAEGDPGHGLWLGGLITWLPETEYEIDANQNTVWDLLNAAFDADPSLTLFSRFNNEYNSEYIYAVQKDDVLLTEKDNHPNSGWMYTLNGANTHVQVGVSVLHLAEGDSIIFHWCDDYQADEAAAGQQDPTQQDKQAAMAVEALIDAIGTPVTLESETAITAARTAYDALNDNAKSYVDPDVYAVLTAAEAALAELKASAQRVADVIAAINALPAADELTLNDETAVAAARAAYDALSEAEQAQVTNLAALEAAEAKIDQLEAEQDQQAASAADQVIAALPAVDAITLDDAAAVAEARAAYDALTPEQQALVNNYDALLAAEAKIAELQEQAASAQRVAEATAAIDALPAADEVTLADEAAVIAARMAYDALSDAEKAQVSADKLIAAEAKIAELKAQQSSQEKITDATDKINAIPAADAVTLADEAAIAAARAAYDALTDAEKAQVDASALVAAEARLAALKFAALKPEVKTANAKNGKIELTITPVAGAVKYKIYVSEKADGTYKEAATVTEAKYTYNGTPGQQYFFKVVAVNGAGVESAESAVVGQFRLPAQVTSLKVKSKKKKEVTLTWKKVTGAKKYVIYMSKNGKTGWKKIGTVKTNKFTYKKAPAGKKMYFRVQAITANGKKGEFSKAVSVKVKK